MTPDLNRTDAAEHSQALFRQLFLASPDAIIVTDINGRISAVNPASEQLFGYSETELIGNLVEMLIPERFRGHHPQHRARLCCRAQRTSHGDRPRTLWASEGRN